MLGRQHIDNGQIKCWGRNKSGELGLEITNPRVGSDGDMGERLQPVVLW